MSTGQQRVAFVGLGDMGLPMASRLLQAGFGVVGCDVRADRAQSFVAAGGQAAPTPRAAAEGAQAIVVIPFDGPQVEDILFGENGALATLPAGSVVLVMATVGPRFMRSLAERLAEYLLVDAPVTGGAARAASGQLTAIASGSEEAMAAARSLLEPMCSNVFVVGPKPGAGQTAKLINQLLVGIHLAASAEAFALATAAGLDVAQLHAVLTSGMARSEILVSRGQAVLDGSLRTGGNMSIFLKDLPLVLDLARDLRIPVFTASAAFNTVQLGAELGRAQQDDAALIALLMELAAGRPQ